MVNVGDRFTYSKDGINYNIKIVSVNKFREPSLKYGADICACNGSYADDVVFFGDDFLNKCERVM